MSGYDELGFWRGALFGLRKRDRWRCMSAEAQQFVTTMLSGVWAGCNGKRSRGDRTIIVQHFQQALREVLVNRGITVPDRVEPVCVAGRKKYADLTFRWWSRPWVIEVKTGLDFNSLGAATLEALAYRAKLKGSRFVLVSLYDSFGRVKDPARCAAKTLRECGIPRPREIKIVSVARRWDAFGDSEKALWYDALADGIEKLLRTLPRAPRAVRARKRKLTG